MTPSACFQVLTLNVSKEARLLIYRKILPLNTWKVYFSIVGSGNPIYFILYKQDSEKGGPWNSRNRSSTPPIVLQNPVLTRGLNSALKR